MTNTFGRRAAVALTALAVLLAGVAAGCADDAPKGLYQGPGDSSPNWR